MLFCEFAFKFLMASNVWTIKLFAIKVVCWVSAIKIRLVVIRPSSDDCWSRLVIKQILLEKHTFRAIKGKTYNFSFPWFREKYSFFLKIWGKISLKICMNHEWGSLRKPFAVLITLIIYLFMPLCAMLYACLHVMFMACFAFWKKSSKVFFLLWWIKWIILALWVLYLKSVNWSLDYKIFFKSVFFLNWCEYVFYYSGFSGSSKGYLHYKTIFLP